MVWQAADTGDQVPDATIVRGYDRFRRNLAYIINTGHTTSNDDRSDHYQESSPYLMNTLS